MAPASTRQSLATLCGLLAALALFGLMMLTLVDVGGRKLLSASVPGALELTELLLVVLIFAGLPLVSLAGEHVVFDSLDRWLPAGVRRVQQALVDALCGAALAGLAWLLWAKAGQMADYGDISSQLKLPLPPFVYGMSVLCAVTAVLHGLLIWRPAVHHHVGVRDEPDPPA